MIESLAWPGVALILGFAALLMFRGAIVRKLDSLSQASRDGLKFDPQQDAEPAKQDALPTLGGDPTKSLPASKTQGEDGQEPPTFEELMKQPITATVLDREKTTGEAFANFILKDEQQRVAVLIRALAMVNVELEFTRASHLLFGSQVSLMVLLAGQQGGLPRERAEAVFDEAKEQFPLLHNERTFDIWLRYLVDSNFVKLVDGNRLDITQLGSDLLKFLVDYRLAHQRAG